MDAIRALNRQPARARFDAAFEFRLLVNAFRTWLRLRAERRALAALDAHLLKDIGVGQVAAQREAARPFWDAPTGRYF